MTTSSSASPSTLPFAEVVREESARAADALAAVPPDARVPACPDWSAADLAYHLGETQDFWSRVVGLAAPDAVVDVGGDPPGGFDGPEREPDDALVPFLRTRTGALLDAFDAHDLSERCWSWSPHGGDVAWALRRQAHEALVHRVDAEQVAGLPVASPPVEVATDGVDEMLAVMMSGLPPWATFTPDDDGRVLVVASDAGRSWLIALGRFAGTSPRTGTTYDLDAGELVARDVAPEDARSTATLTGSAWDLDLWLWGRGPLDALAVEGERAVVDRFREVLVESSQ
ncbi:maleylpyruvate isomerase family mycothiol-dependent enzyme [Cellulomonas algicola]|uniref:maleylpyruvate isomerase family mycothiol-dependent enzyme n=1 Tax=Cellulomonas algicola TaxID=2071633 RepID=UPI001C3FBE69|nr:maleylpyruvate isomerase family mycothiol-dependent enzyme [Cellulomonas algicola]